MLRDKLLQIRMRLTPPSSRSFYTRTDELLALLNKVDSHLDDLDEKIADLSRQVAMHEARSEVRWQGSYHQAGETAEEMKRRFFSSIPPTTGVMRSFQLANARLLHDFDRICQENGITYWMCFGSLVATVSRSGSIPWDDDVDVCMTREDLQSLENALAQNEAFQLTLAYDGYVFCKQYRFSLRDKRVPCFVDVCVWDWAADCTQAHDDRFRQLRLELMDEFSRDDKLLSFWSEHPVLYAPESGEVVQIDGFSSQKPEEEAAENAIENIEARFARFQSRAIDEGILCEEANASGLAYGLSNIYDAPWRRTIFPREMIFPVKRLIYEGYEVCVPNDYKGVCDECYPGWPYVPSDILGHNHLPKHILEDKEVSAALERYSSTGVV